MAPRTLLFATTLLTASVLPLIAQEKTATGYTMDWTRTLQERPDPFMNARHTLNGWSFMVYECSAGEAMGHWKKHMEKLGGTAKSSKPTRVTGAAIPGLASSPPFVFANAKKDASAGGVRMYIAFALSDTTSIADEPGLVTAVHEMAVQVNRAVVQEQVAEQEKRSRKISGEVKDAQKEEAKAAERAGDAGKDLQKVNEQQAKLARKQADLQKDLNKLQEKYRIEADPKTLEKIAKTQQRIAEVEKDMAKKQEAESEAQEHKNKHDGQIPEAQKHKEKHESEKERVNRELESLKRKLEAIR